MQRQIKCYSFSPATSKTESMHKYGQIVQQILDALQTCGPMTRTELCQHINVDRGTTAAVVSRLLRPSPKYPKRVYIKGYVYDQEGERCYPRAVYDLGDKPDAKKPKADKLGVKRRYVERKKMKYATNSVFNLARIGSYESRT